MGLIIAQKVVSYTSWIQRSVIGFTTWKSRMGHSDRSNLHWWLFAPAIRDLSYRRLVWINPTRRLANRGLEWRLDYTTNCVPPAFIVRSILHQHTQYALMRYYQNYTTFALLFSILYLVQPYCTSRLYDTKAGTSDIRGPDTRTEILKQN